MSEQRVFRVTVRGRFHELTDRARRYLIGARAEHDIFMSAFTPEGTFTYDERILFFNLRYEIRADGPDAESDAITEALLEAEAFLDTMGFGYQGLSAKAADLSAMWTARAGDGGDGGGGGGGVDQVGLQEASRVS